jgi:diaminopimelate decarboxylase
MSGIDASGAGPRLDFDDLEQLSKEHGESFFVLDGTRFASNFDALHGAFSRHYPRVTIGYSYKTNYTPQLCRLVHARGGHAEVVSEMELDLAMRLGVPGERIIFNGPVKSRDAIERAALSGATINIDSHRDLGLLLAVARANPAHRVAVVLRCNFDLGGSHAISRFGMDTDGEEFAGATNSIAATPSLDFKGLHCHFPDRDLESFGRRAEAMVALVQRVFPTKPPEVLNIGGGYFSHMPESLRARFDVPPASFNDYGKLVGGILSAAFAGQKAPTLFLEPGTAIVADTQSFYTRVVSIKTVRGKSFVTVAGSSFDISPTARSRSLPVTPVVRDLRGDPRSHDVVGYTCIEKDLLSEELYAALRPGDFLRYDNVGSYSIVMRPPFISPSNPILFHDGSGRSLELIKRRQTMDDVFSNFVF